MDIFEKRLFELAERASERCYVTFSDFLNMEEQSELASLALPCDYATFGGYDGAERAVAAFGNGCQYAEFPVKIIKAEPLSQKFADKLSHRDFLGSLMGLGIKRNVLGDIVIKENTGYIFCLDSIADYIVQNLDKVRHTSIKCSVVHELPAGAVAEPEEKEIIVASLRLDVLAAAVYNFSRSGVKELFVQSKVFVNSALCENFSYNVKPGDIVSVRGNGRFKCGNVLGSTKKGRTVLRIFVYK